MQMAGVIGAVQAGRPNVLEAARFASASTEVAARPGWPAASLRHWSYGMLPAGTGPEFSPHRSGRPILLLHLSGARLSFAVGADSRLPLSPPYHARLCLDAQFSYADPGFEFVHSNPRRHHRCWRFRRWRVPETRPLAI